MIAQPSEGGRHDSTGCNSEQDLRLTTYPTSELLHQSGLADAGLTGDEERSWLACRCRLRPLLQPSQLSSRLTKLLLVTLRPVMGSSIA
jgi:hypothetical protein